MVSPPPGVSSAVSVPPMASVKPRATRRPEAEPARVAVAEPLERGEQPIGLAAGDAGSAVDDAQFHAVGVGAGAQGDRRAAAVAQRVVDDVGDDAFEQAGVGEDLGDVLVDLDLDAVRAVEAAQCERRHLVVADRLELRGRRRRWRSGRSRAGCRPRR